MLAAVLLPVVGLVCQATSSTLTHEGGFWVRKTSGTLACPAKARLKVVTRGNVVVRGDQRDGLHFDLEQKTQSATRQNALFQLRDVNIGMRTGKDLQTAILLPQDRDGTECDIRINVPAGLRSLEIDSQGGDIAVYDLQGLVEAHTAAGAVRLDRIGSNAVAKTGGGEIQVGSIGGTLRCFSAGGSIHVDTTHGETWCETAGGEIGARNIGGPLHASTEGGNIKVGHVQGWMTARSAGGLIEIQQADGLVRAETRGGSIQIGAAQGAQCDSAAGTIRLKNVAGGIRVATASGSILAELLSKVPLEDSFLSTNSGDITLLIPSKTAASILARSETMGAAGRIVSDFPEIKVRPGKGGQPVMAEGVLNGGGPLIRILAAKGTIYLRRQKD